MIVCIHPTHSFASRRRGSVFLLVVVLLALLALMATTLTYMGRLEALAARNAGKTVQNRMAAVTGVAPAMGLAPSHPSAPVAHTQAWNRVLENRRLHARKAMESRAASGGDAPEVRGTGLPQAMDWTAIEDQAAFWNINAIAPLVEDETLEISYRGYLMPAEIWRDFLLTRAQEANLQVPVERLVRSMLRYRWGPNGKPDSLVVDIQQDPEGDDRFFLSLASLLELPEMTPELLRVIEPFCSVYSCSLEVWMDEDGYVQPMVPLNVAEPEEILAALQRAFPRASDDVLYQYALNMIDKRDEDSIPTFFVEEEDLSGLPLLGYENTPIITEVCSDVISSPEQEDNGEFIEIHNPTDQAVSLAGWDLRIGRQRYALSRTLPPGGFLVVTDDIMNANDPTPESNQSVGGSFYAVFGYLPVREHQQLIEIQGMDIPDASGVVRLYDDKNRLIDYLSYSEGLFQGNNKGLHREHVLSRVTRPDAASPFFAALGGSDTMDLDNQQDWFTFRSTMNRPFYSPVELLSIPLRMLRHRGQAPLDQGLFPALESLPGDYQPNVRLLDIFTCDLPVANTREGLPLAYGKCNLNTMPIEILRAMPGMQDGLAENIQDIREEKLRESEAFWRGVDALPTRRIVAPEEEEGITSQTLARKWEEPAAPFANYAELASHPGIWNAMPRQERLMQLDALLPLISVRSSVFRVVHLYSGERPDPEAPGHWQGCETLITTNPYGQSEIQDWRFVTSKY